LDIRVEGTDGKKVYICHAPPGNPGNGQTLSVNISSVKDHLLSHANDKLGKCGSRSMLATIETYNINEDDCG
jgi:hypothetical protein